MYYKYDIYIYIYFIYHIMLDIIYISLSRAIFARKSTSHFNAWAFHELSLSFRDEVRAGSPLSHRQLKLGNSWKFNL